MRRFDSSCLSFPYATFPINNDKSACGLYWMLNCQIDHGLSRN